MSKVETIRVKHPMGGLMLINKEDFDSKVHTLFDAPAPKPAPKAAPEPVANEEAPAPKKKTPPRR